MIQNSNDIDDNSNTKKHTDSFQWKYDTNTILWEMLVLYINEKTLP